MSRRSLAFYSKATTDFEYLFPFGWGELWGVADRTDYDLTQHQNHSGKSMEYLDPVTNEKYIPYCIEPSAGRGSYAAGLPVRRLRGAGAGGRRRAHRCCTCIPRWRPTRRRCCPCRRTSWAVWPPRCMSSWCKHFPVEYDETGSIGKRYRRQDEIGTPFCICVDFDTEATGTVTVRDRDTMQQERVAIADLRSYIEKRLQF